MISLTSISEVVSSIGPLDADAKARAGQRQRILTKPPGSLGRLEALSIQLAGIFGTDRPRPDGKTVIVAAGDHGVVAQGVTGYPQEVTAQMVANFLGGGAAVTAMARHSGVRVVVVDAGIATELPHHPDLRLVRTGSGTADITRGPAMSREQAEHCLLAGANLALDVARDGADLIGTGDMGIGNTTASSAIVAALTGRPPEETTGKGTGRTRKELDLKTDAVRRALSVNRFDPGDGVDVLAKLGGFEIGVLAGAVLGGAMARRAVVLDGFISGAAALVACRLCPTVIDYLIASHRSAERGHRVILRELGLRPLLTLDMRLGEGTGAVLAMGIVEAAAACLAEMATFEEASVTDREPSAEPNR